MAINFAALVYAPNFDAFARPVTIVPLASQPGAGAYDARGIFDHNEMDVDVFGEVVFSDGRVELDILIGEFEVPPKQRDQVRIPYHEGVAGGDFEISDVDPCNAGGEVTLTLKDIVPAKAPGYVAEAQSFALGPLDIATPALAVT